VSQQQVSLPQDYLTIAGQKRVLEAFERLVERRAHDEVELPRAYAQRDAQLQADFEAQRQRLIASFQSQYEKSEAEYAKAKEDAEHEYDNENYIVGREHQEAMDGILQKFRVEDRAAKEAKAETQAKAAAEFERNKKQPIAEFAAVKQTCAAQKQAIATLTAEAVEIVRARRIQPPAPPTSPSPEEPVDDPEHAFQESMLQGRELITHNENLLPARFIYEGWPVILMIFLPVAGFFLFAFVLQWSWTNVFLFGVGGGMVAAGVISLLVYPLARNRTVAIHRRFQEAMARATAANMALYNRGKEKFEPVYQALVATRDRKMMAAHEERTKIKKRLEAERDEKLDKTQKKFDERFDAIRKRRKQRHAEADAHYPPLLKRLKAEHEQQLADLDARRERELEESRQAFEDDWNKLVEDWHAGVAQFQATIDATNEFCRERVGPWEEIDWQRWKPPLDAPPAVRFGQFQLRVDDFPGGISQNEDLPIDRTEYDLPSLVTFPECPSLLLQADGDARDHAIRTMQNVMLRMLATMPAGKVRFTIVDPTGRGQNFSAFMHLADFDEQLVTNRIWTESTHINKRLVDITEHMENVIQKYLRNEFESIQQYNEHAGEVAEPYRVLVVANYPANFSEEAARRLISIATSGPRCGVSTLISVDAKMAAERKFDLADLEAAAVTLKHDGDKFQYQDELLGRFPLTLDAPPSDASFTDAVRTIGKAAEDSSRVEVPFDSVLPPDDRWWHGDSRAGIDVPLGRAGATKLQHMRLGKGTSQHVLMAGKTGSGKSTLLNALVTNLSAIYGPEELEFYLIDFKKGVEFKPYATYRLPQARVIAIESEREFGLSVLQRLDEELKRRGDLFRSLGVQDVKGFRDANPDEPMPRILLIVDEFQELFVADDHVAREATLLLDRLVRQGRAFGMHVILGTQTLAGAYSLARSTIGQMAVRVALQCSESDAHLILSEDNTAARLLNRPGAAIYNDANGLIEGNNPFQVVWLPDHEREACLRQIADLAAERNVKTPPAIVFEGNIPSDPADNQQLTELVESGCAKPATAPRAWLGASVAIKEPTSVTFARHSGTNLLVVGQHEELAAGVLATSTVALAAHRTVGSNGSPARTGPQIVVLDGARPDEPTAGFWRRVARSISPDTKTYAPKDCAAAIGEVSKELQRRTDEDDEAAPSLVVVVYNLARFRDLQKSDDDFGFSNFGEEEKVSPSKQFTEILREGPNRGIHVLVWADGYNNVNRWFDRNTLRDLEMRVLFQVSSTDSSNLIDSPIASNLGVNRAVLYDDERGEYEKFRPYGLCSDEWLGWVRRTLANRSGDVGVDTEKSAAT